MMKRVSAIVALAIPAIALGQSTPPLEVKLVAIDTGRMPEPASLQVKRAAAAIRAAGAHCTAQGEQLADQALSTSQAVQKQGNIASTVEVLEGLDAVLFDLKAPQDCKTILARYAAMRREGYSHSRTVVMQRALMRSATDAAPR
ncbi:hypothetical protein [Roseateles chitinivorans]|uniref:hypothetical protein n=1 Tax=Roseateles chitinivorans TaxID=2917965 RepID=UPI003D669D71